MLFFREYAIILSNKFNSLPEFSSNAIVTGHRKLLLRRGIHKKWNLKARWLLDLRFQETMAMKSKEDFYETENQINYSNYAYRSINN